MRMEQSTSNTWPISLLLGTRTIEVIGSADSRSSLRMVSVICALSQECLPAFDWEYQSTSSPCRRRSTCCRHSFLTPRAEQRTTKCSQSKLTTIRCKIQTPSLPEVARSSGTSAMPCLNVIRICRGDRTPEVTGLQLWAGGQRLNLPLHSAGGAQQVAPLVPYLLPNQLLE